MILKISKILVINSVIIFILAEVILRLLWQSPYVSSYESAYLHEKLQRITFRNINLIYGSNETIDFNTGIYGEIIGPHHSGINFKKSKFNIALGGSTTETALVEENYRWTDLLNTPTLNFGKSRLNSSHTYKNYVHILNNYQLIPEFVFLMDGSNNLSAYLSRGEKSLDSPDDSTGIYRKALKYSYSLALVWTTLKKSDYLKFYKAQVALNSKIPLISDNELQLFWKNNKLSILQTIKKSLKKFKVLSDENNINLIVLTQPHAFFEDFSKRKNELRTTPIINEKRLSLSQAGWLMDEFNKATIESAMELKINFFDISKCLQENKSIDMYDAFHYTKKGSLSFADCLNNYFEQMI